MKKPILTLTILLLSITAYAQTYRVDPDNQVTKVTTEEFDIKEFLDDLEDNIKRKELYKRSYKDNLIRYIGANEVIQDQYLDLNRLTGAGFNWATIDQIKYNHINWDKVKNITFTDASR